MDGWKEGWEGRRTMDGWRLNSQKRPYFLFLFPGLQEEASRVISFSFFFCALINLSVY